MSSTHGTTTTATPAPYEPTIRESPNRGAGLFVGTVFLLVCLFRAIAGGFTPKQHFGFEAAAWYWHFVDVVWLFLFFAIYIWGGWGAPVHSG